MMPYRKRSVFTAMKKRLKIKKQMIVCLVGVLLTTALCGCGSKNTKEPETTQNESAESVSQSDLSNQTTSKILPEQVTIKEVGDDIQLNNNDYSAEVFCDRMFWGEWILKDSYQKEHYSASDKYLDIKVDGSSYKMECLPAGLSFGTMSYSFGEASDATYTFNEGTYASIGYQFGEDGSTDDDNNLYAIKPAGAAQGDVSLDCTYHVDGNVLALGMFGNISDRQAGDTLPVTEVDYTFEWSGSELTLHYGEESAVYVPEKFEENNHQIIIEQTSLINSSDLENPVVHLRSGDTQNEDRIERKYDASIEGTVALNDDGSASIIDGAGNDYGFTSYYYSGNTITLEGQNQITILEITSEMFSLANLGLASWQRASWNIGGNSTDSMLGQAVEKQLESGYQTTTDTEFYIKPGQLASYDAAIEGHVIHCRALNVYKNEAPLSKCLVCYETIDNDDVGIGVPSNEDKPIEVGESTFMEIKDMCDSVYSASPKRIVLKCALPQEIKPFQPEGAEFGEQVIKDVMKGEIVFSFTNDILSGVSYEIPEYLYGGLQDNVDGDELAEMNQTQIASTIDTRDNVLQKLREAFEKSGTEVEIDPSSGLIRLSNDILFDSGLAEVKPEAKGYLTEVLTIFSNVLLSEDVKQYIKNAEISGHCDRDGTQEFNQALSEQRAGAVKKVFLESESNFSETQLDQLSELLVTKGYSFNDPVFDDSGNFDYEKSRRVEVKFFVNTEIEAPIYSDNKTEDNGKSDVLIEDPDEVTVPNKTKTDADSGNGTPDFEETKFFIGTIEGNTYSNSGFRVQLKDGWSFGDEKKITELNGVKSVQESYEQDHQAFDMYASNEDGTMELATMVLWLGEGRGKAAFTDLDVYHRILEFLHENFTGDEKTLPLFSGEITKKPLGSQEWNTSSIQYQDEDGKMIYYDRVFMLYGDVMEVVNICCEGEDNRASIAEMFQMNA